MLVVDDEELVARAINRIFSRLGFEIATANCVDAALELVSKGAFDVVVTDFNMPGRDGIDLAKEIMAKQPGAMVLVQSGKPGEAKAKGEATGIKVKFIELPYTEDADVSAANERKFVADIIQSLLVPNTVTLLEKPVPTSSVREAVSAALAAKDVNLQIDPPQPAGDPRPL
jgi:two-component system chemotaxis response regulator CheB